MRNTWSHQEIVCAHCGYKITTNTLVMHFINKHQWRLNTKGEPDKRASPMPNQGGKPE